MLIASTTQERKIKNMQDRKEKTRKQTKVQDLKPKKDAKGGVIAIIRPTQQGAGKNPTSAGRDWSQSSGGD